MDSSFVNRWFLALFYMEIKEKIRKKKIRQDWIDLKCPDRGGLNPLFIPSFFLIIFTYLNWLKTSCNAKGN